MEHRRDHPSVKLHHAPGGNSNFSLGWGNEEKPQQPKNQTAATLQQTTAQDQPEVKKINQQESSSVW